MHQQDTSAFAHENLNKNKKVSFEQSFNDDETQTFSGKLYSGL